MAKYTYYAIDCISSAQRMVLHDPSGSPPMDVRSFRAYSTFGTVTTAIQTFVGCKSTSGRLITMDNSLRRFQIELEIQTFSMDTLYTKIEALRGYLDGDRTVPGGDERFRLIIAKDGATEYGYQQCTWTGWRDNLRPYLRDGATDYHYVDQPIFTRILIEAETGYITPVNLSALP